MTQGIAIGFTLGIVVMHLLQRWKLLYRHCCREHYATHVYCDCSDCIRERAAQPEEKP